MNGLSLPEPNQIPSYIESLCDLIPNNRRNFHDFHSLQLCLEQYPKECTPFKKRILQHIQIHALENPRANLRLLSSCFAKATLLFRKTPNKDEGPLGAWKSGLAGELLSLEENINSLYEIANIHSPKIITRGNVDQDEEDLKSKEKLTESKSEFESIIDEHLLKIDLSANNICALINVKTDFDLPIPIIVILRLAAKIGLLRWKDYKKNFANLVRTHVYSLSPRLIEIELALLRSVINVMGTNIIPFCPFINQTIFRTLEWTRTSNLVKFDENLYYSLRTRLLDMVLFTTKQLSLNINLETRLLNSLIDVELVASLESLTSCQGNENTAYQVEYMIEALTLLENLIIIYSGLLTAPLEYKIKSYVVQLCIQIYREFRPNALSLPVRKQLIQLLLTIANQPYATSTTEISHHILELVMKVESDSDLVQFVRRSLKVGFSHRPVIMSHLDGYNYQFFLKPAEKQTGKDSGGDEEEREDEEEENRKDEDVDEVIDVGGGATIETEKAMETTEAVDISRSVDNSNTIKPVESLEAAVKPLAEETEPKEQEADVRGGEGQKDGDDEDDEADQKVLSMLDSFVNKLA